MTILAGTMYTLSRAFKIEQVVKKKHTPVVVTEEVIEAPQEVPLWIPWSYGWLGGYTGPVRRDMPHYYPGARDRRDERGAPDGHHREGRIFHKL